MTCVSKSLSDLDAEPLGGVLFADEGRDGVDPGFEAGLDLAAPETSIKMFLKKELGPLSGNGFPFNVDFFQDKMFSFHTCMEL